MQQTLITSMLNPVTTL